jgi:hypothetical protein
MRGAIHWFWAVAGLTAMMAVRRSIRLPIPEVLVLDTMVTAAGRLAWHGWWVVRGILRGAGDDSDS